MMTAAGSLYVCSTFEHGPDWSGHSKVTELPAVLAAIITDSALFMAVVSHDGLSSHQFGQDLLVVKYTASLFTMICVTFSEQ